MLIPFHYTRQHLISHVTCRVAQIAVTLIPAALSALDPTTHPAQYLHTAWQNEQGLPQNSVSSIVQTHDGYLWLGTMQGLARFDGIRFTVFNTRTSPGLGGNRITALHEDREGLLWIGTERGGASTYDGKAIRKRTLPEAFERSIIRAFAEDEAGAMWIATTMGLLCRRGDEIVACDTNSDRPIDAIATVHVDRSGDIWVGTSGGGLARLANGRVDVFDRREGLCDNYVNAMTAAADGSLWIGTVRGLSCYRDGGFRSYRALDALAGEFIWSLTTDADGNLWIGTAGRGLFRYRDGLLSSFTTEDGLTSDFVWSLQTDREGSLWIGTNGGGLSRLRDGRVSSFSTRDGLAHDFAWCVMEDAGGNMWIGTSDGLTRYSNGHVRTYGAKDGLASTFVYSLEEDSSGRIWAGTNAGGLSYLVGERFLPFGEPESLPGQHVWDMLAEADGRLWVATATGLGVVQDGRVTGKFGVEEGLPSANVRTVFRDRHGTLWAGTTAGVATLVDGRFVPLTARDGLGQGVVRVISEDSRGDLWIGMQDGGLTRLADGRFRTYDARHGLLDDTVSQLLDDRQGKLWMSSNSGIFAVELEDFDRLESGQIHKLPCVVYGRADGMRSQECNGSSQPAGWRSRDGRLWFPTIRGVAIIDPSRIRMNPIPPPVVIEGMIVDGAVVDLARAIALAPGSHRIEIRYTGLSMAVPERVAFKYRLDGYDPDWLDVGSRRTAFYTNLAPGRYRFEVTACNEDGVWNRDGSSIEFQLLPRFYQTRWFLLITVAALGLAAWAGYALRIRQIETRFNAVLIERHRIAQEIHDTMAQGLTGLSMQLEALGDSMADDPERARKHLDHSRRLVRTSVGEVRRLVWDLRPRILEDRTFAQALHAMANDATQGTQIEVAVRAAGSQKPLPARVETNLLRIAQEAVTNAVRHSGARHIEIEIEQRMSSVRMLIRDDGRGFTWPLPASAAVEHYGVSGMHERAEQIKAELHMRSAPGKGAEIEIIAPIGA